MDYGYATGGLLDSHSPDEFVNSQTHLLTCAFYWNLIFEFWSSES